MPNRNDRNIMPRHKRIYGLWNVAMLRGTLVGMTDANHPVAPERTINTSLVIRVWGNNLMETKNSIYVIRSWASAEHMGLALDFLPYENPK